ncbi:MULTISPECIES: type 1 glutamine amidotransferase [unclassified Acinetobacter]|uniref:type 1 glutamine amidotransferase n=1 Tax=unclassified Acinetobacter TaxID=196816 RepID=UPI000B3C866E|nr:MULTISPECIES: type 1 glutamine amidotransferase [unclassified Acinetobacter]AZM39412.1 type 1 glutamine amidotransferase [Acinetobacter baumannii]NWK81334.1 type 1 glutamine amidotransferase [Acinetobacter sp. SwsAc4]
MKSHLRVHYFQHIAGEGFGSCYDYLKAHQAKITATEFFALPVDLSLELEALPNIDEVDLLIIMGGTMSVNDEANYPWLKLEKRWLRRYLSAGKPAIGLCLGGQLIANALGASVSRNQHQELGWMDVVRVSQVPENYFQIPEKINIMQWHSETFEIPKGGVRLAENRVCRNQLYQIGRNVLGFQFHPEMTPHALQLLIENEEDSAVFNGEYVQPIAELKKTIKSKFEQGNQLLNRAIEYVVNA